MGNREFDFLTSGNRERTAKDFHSFASKFSLFIMIFYDNSIISRSDTQFRWAGLTFDLVSQIILLTFFGLVNFK